MNTQRWARYVWRLRRASKGPKGHDPVYPVPDPDGTQISQINIGHRGVQWPSAPDDEAMRKAGVDWMNEWPT